MAGFVPALFAPQGLHLTIVWRTACCITWNHPRNWSHALTNLCKSWGRIISKTKPRGLKTYPKIQKELKHNAAVSQRAEPTYQSQYTQEEMVCQATQLLGWNPEDGSENSSFHHQVPTSKPLSQVIWYFHKPKQEKRGDENFRWDPAVSSEPSLSTRNYEPEAETMAKRKALACPHCLQIWVSQQPPGLLYSQNRQEDLPSLSKFIGQASELLSAIQPQCPAGRGQLKIPDKHSASSQGSPGWRKDQLSHLAHTPVCSQQQQVREWQHWPKRQILHQQKWEYLFPQEQVASTGEAEAKILQWWNKSLKEPEKAKMSLLHKCLKSRQIPCPERHASCKRG